MYNYKNILYLVSAIAASENQSITLKNLTQRYSF